MSDTSPIAALSALPATLKVVRAIRNKSLRDVADETGIAPSTINRVEQGADPRLSTALTLLAWIGQIGSLDRMHKS